MKRFIPVFLAVTVLALLIGSCFAETIKISGKATEVAKDTKGRYYLNDNGSKMRLSDADLEKAKKGEPFMSTLAAEDMSQTDIAKLEQDKAKAEQDRELRAKEQEKQMLINEKMKALAIEQLQKEGKLDANGEIVK
jgi:hypothetical protein